jgi:hypothetical protein
VKIIPALVLLALSPAALLAQAPAGVEFQVNAYTTGVQGEATVASNANGDFVVVWASPDGGAYGVFGQRFSASGVRQASEFRINSYTTNSQVFPSVGSDANGNFVVVWHSYSQDGSSTGVFGQRFDRAGALMGSEFRVNSYTTDSQRFPSVALHANGSVVVWSSNTQDGSAGGIFGRRFSASGVPQGSEFRVNSYTTGNQAQPAVASDESGNFVVVWSSATQDGSSYGIFGQRFDASGVPQGGEFGVNSYTTGLQQQPIVAPAANGDFVVVWSSDGQDADSHGVFGRRFDASGTPLGAEFQVNSYTTGGQSLPFVSADENGNFVVAWNSSGQDGSGLGVFGQRFDASGAPQGAEFRVNTSTVSDQLYPMLASNPDGDFVVVWESLGQDGSSYGVFAQRYGDLIFEDGFDSGDLTRWSSNATDGGDVSVSPAAAMAGTGFGLQAVVNDFNGIFVQDDTPAAENRYRARFYFDPNGFDPGEANAHFRTRVFIAFDGSNQRIITIVLKRQGGAYSLEGRVRLNDGTRADTGFFGITDGPHVVEFDWRRASAPAAGNGTFDFWLDNALMATLTGLDNDVSPIEFARMGAFSVKTGAGGTLFYDQFESRRQRLIGPE